jgi:predicted RNase H-like HicB family nuclease
MLCYQVAYYLPKGEDRMVVAEVLDFPRVVSQGFDLADARVMIARALEEMALMFLEEGRPLPVPNSEASAEDADLVELGTLSVEAGVPRRFFQTRV